MIPFLMVLIVFHGCAQDSMDVGRRVAEIMAEAEKCKGYDRKLTVLLAELGKPAVPELVRYLDDSRDRVVVVAVDALAMMSDHADSIVPILLKRLSRDGDVGDELRALHALSKRPQGAALIAKDPVKLHEIIEEGPSANAYVAARILGFSGDRTSIPILSSLVKRSKEKPDENFADYCERGGRLAMARLGEKDALQQLAGELSCDDAPVRFKAICDIMLYVMRKDLVPKIVPLLDDTRYPTADGTQPTKGDIRYSDRVCDVAAFALGVIVPQDFFKIKMTVKGPDLRQVSEEEISRWKEWWVKGQEDPEYK